MLFWTSFKLGSVLHFFVEINPALAGPGKKAKPNNYGDHLRYGVWLAIFIMAVLLFAHGTIAAAQKRDNSVPATPKAGALIDLTGYWVQLITEDWRWRMTTPPKGDYASMPLTEEGRRVADTWDPARDKAAGNQCRVYGAAGLMRVPGRLHITWANDNTLKIEKDAGMQTRLLHFDPSKLKPRKPTWQGNSLAKWERQFQVKGFSETRQFHTGIGRLDTGKGGSLRVVTTNMRPGYIRENGVPYSGNAVLTEYFDRFDLDGASYLILTQIVEDPQYFTERLVTSEHYRREIDGAKWDPSPCTAD